MATPPARSSGTNPVAAPTRTAPPPTISRAVASAPGDPEVNNRPVAPRLPPVRRAGTRQPAGTTAATANGNRPTAAATRPICAVLAPTAALPATTAIGAVTAARVASDGW